MTHAINRAEYQRSQGVIGCVIVCECGEESAGFTWAEAGEAHDKHIDGKDIDYNPREMDGDPRPAWREWYQGVKGQAR